MSEAKKSFEERLQDVKDMNRRLTVLQEGGEQEMAAPGE